MFRQVVAPTAATPIATPIAQHPIYHIQAPGIGSNNISLGRPNSAGPIVLQSSNSTSATASTLTTSPAPVLTVLNPINRSQSQSTGNTTNTTSTAAPSSNSVSPPLDSVGSRRDATSATITTTNSTSNVNATTASTNNNSNNNTCLPSSSTSSLEIADYPLPPKKDIMKFVRERCEFMSLTDLIAEHEELCKDMKEAQRNRANCEKSVNEFVRQARGQNVEHHPKFIRLKEEKSIHDADCKGFDQALKYVSDKLDKRFNYKISPSTRVVQPLQGKRQQSAKPKTARMGTTPRPSKAPSHPEKPDKDDKHILLDIKDSNLWCRDCEIHYPTFKEFCDHLHKREHLARCSKPTQPPWRGTFTSQLPRQKSYDTFKSICAKLANNLRRDFTLQDLDEVINPSLRGETSKLKQITLKRERGDFAPDDTLFTYKGYDMLIPINGYYCKLCDQVLCDFVEAERHFKSVKHNSEHAKSIALHPSHERMFRQSLEKSYKDQFGGEINKKDQSPKKNRDVEKSRDTEKSRDAERSRDIEKSKTTSSSSLRSNEPSTSSSSAHSASTSKEDRGAHDKTKTGTSVPLHWSARLPYKKPTSRIVDEHDAIADKFDKRDEARADRTTANRDVAKSSRPTSTESASSLKTTTSTANATKEANNQERSKLDKRKEPEIMPLNINPPSAALKRLRNDNGKKQQQEETTVENDRNKEQQQQNADDNIVADDNVNPNSRLESSSEDEESVATQRAKRKARLNAKKRANKDLSDTEEDTDDVQIVREVCLEKGHKESPFPDLELSISGNVHYDTLKDPRLAAPLKVKLNRINLEDYKHMLLDEATLWSRVDLLMTKKEPEEYKKDLSTATAAAPTFFKPNGDTVPLSVDFSSSSDDDDKSTFELGMLENFFCEKT